MDEEVESEENFPRHSRIQTPGWLVNDEKGRSSDQGARESELPLVSSAEVADALEEIEVKELGEVEYLADGVSDWKSSELAIEVEVVEGSEALLEVVLIQTHSHIARGERGSLEQVVPQHIADSSERRPTHSSEQVDELGLPALSGTIQCSHASLLDLELVLCVSVGVLEFKRDRRVRESDEVLLWDWTKSVFLYFRSIIKVRMK